MDQFAEACGVAGSAVLLDCRSLEWRPVRPRRRVASWSCTRVRTRHARRVGVQPRRHPMRGRPSRPSPRTTRRSPRCATSRRSISAAAKTGSTPSRTVAPTTSSPRTSASRRSSRRSRRASSPQVGAAFAASHASLRDRFDVVSPGAGRDGRDRDSAVPGVVAARMTGAGFGGCTVNLVRPDAVDALRDAVERDYPARMGLTPRVLPVAAAAGAGRLRLTRPRHVGAVERHTACRAVRPGHGASLAPLSPVRPAWAALPGVRPQRADRSNRPRPSPPDHLPLPVEWRLHRDHPPAVPRRRRHHRRDRAGRRLHRAGHRAPRHDQAHRCRPVRGVDHLRPDRQGRSWPASAIPSARWSTFEEIPPILVDATTAVEDKTFWENAGFDPVAIISAGLDSLRGNGRGASTITQQLVRARLLPCGPRPGPARTRRAQAQGDHPVDPGDPGVSGRGRQAGRSSPPISTRTTTATRVTASRPRTRTYFGKAVRRRERHASRGGDPRRRCRSPRPTTTSSAMPSCECPDRRRGRRSLARLKAARRPEDTVVVQRRNEILELLAAGRPDADRPRTSTGRRTSRPPRDDPVVLSQPGGTALDRPALRVGGP